eukprot:363750-Chlamydomonas_euryale.AAC.1
MRAGRRELGEAGDQLARLLRHPSNDRDRTAGGRCAKLARSARLGARLRRRVRRAQRLGRFSFVVASGCGIGRVGAGSMFMSSCSCQHIHVSMFMSACSCHVIWGQGAG